MALSVMKPAKVKEGHHGILYGPPGSGKTSTLDDPKLKILLADAEGGTSVLEGAENIDRVPIESWDDLVEFGKSVRQGFIDLGNGEKFIIDHDLIALDSLTRIQDLCKEFIALKYAPNRKREIVGKFGAMADWGDLGMLLTGMVKAWHGITKAGANSKHVLWLAHVEVEKDEVSGAATRTKIQLQGKATPDIISSIVDGQYYMLRRVLENGEEEFGILSRPKGIISAKTRVSKEKRGVLPEYIVNPQWSDIFTTLGYTKE